MFINAAENFTPPTYLFNLATVCHINERQNILTDARLWFQYLCVFQELLFLETQFLLHIR